MRLPAAPRRNSEIQLLMHPHPHPHLHSLISLSAPVLDSTEFRALLVFLKILPAAYGSEDSKRVHNVLYISLLYEYIRVYSYSGEKYERTILHEEPMRCNLFVWLFTSMCGCTSI